MQQTDNATKKIGENLLKGWTLLGEVCPAGCNVPLMRSRDNQHVICCACDKDFVQIPSTDSQAVEVSKTAMGSTSAVSSSINPSSFSRLASAVDFQITRLAERLERSYDEGQIEILLSNATKLIYFRKLLGP